jgi:hypothetical protein
MVAADSTSAFSQWAVWIAVAALLLLVVAPPVLVLINRKSH